MSLKLAFGLLLTLLSACNQNGQDNSIGTLESFLTSDTLVGSKTITNEIAGSVYRKRATGYFLIANSDTSDFVCIFAESKHGGQVSMDIRFEKRSMTYRERMAELEKILPEAKKDFEFDSLRSLYLGRLVFNGDIAIDVTKQYQHRFGKTDNVVDLKTASQFLKESKLGTDLNELFNQYSISVDRVSPEKLFFTTKRELYWASKVETDTTEIPDKILDCMTWVGLRSRK